MAALAFGKDGSCRIMFGGAADTRKTIHLPKGIARKNARSMHAKVEALIEARDTGTTLAPEDSAWVRDLPDAMHAKLVRVGLAEPRHRMDATLGVLTARVFAALEVKTSTRTAYGLTRDSLETHFGTDRRLDSIGPLHAEDWKASMVGAELAPATIAKRVRVARGFFRQAVRWRMIAENPFADVKAGGQTNRERVVIVPLSVVERVISACDPTSDWPALIALARYGGLRIPSEIQELRWADVLWDSDRLIVRPSKTEAHEGRAVRHVPLFPRLRELLLDRFHRAETGTEFVFDRTRRTSANLRTHFHRLIERAGVAPWPKTFQNLRASRATELVREYPQHVVAAWLGHTEAVAKAHYLTVSDLDFAKAARTPDPTGAESGAPTAQNPTLHASARKPTGAKRKPERAEFAGVARDDAHGCASGREWSMAPPGLEPGTGRL